MLNKNEIGILHNFYSEKLAFCDCGNPEYTLLFIKNILNTIKEKVTNWSNEDYNKEASRYYNMYLQDLISTFEFNNSSSSLTNSQKGIVQFVLYHLDNVGVLEHGSGIDAAWLSEYGHQILNILNKIDDFEEFDLN